MSDLTTLIDRVRGLEGPDREVDVAVLLALGIMTLERRQRDRKEWLYVVGSSYERHDPRMLPARFKLTASLDAVVSLIERELPGKHWSISKSYGPHSPMRSFGDGDFAAKCGSWGAQKRAEHDAPTLALLLAFLTVMKERVQ